jgi:ribosome biogenesis GTPase
MQRLEQYGWCSHFSRQIESATHTGEPGRVVGVFGVLRVATAGGDVDAVPPSRWSNTTATVGDWVLAAPGGPRGMHRVTTVLERRTALVRKVAGAVTAPQALAANVDVVLVVMGLDGDANARRTERWVAAIRESGAEPVVLLNKADVAADAPAALREIEAAAPGVDIHLVSALDGRGMEAVQRALAPGRTGVLVGSSGAGKSTLVNRLLGDERQRTATVRAHDHRGRHTTTSRELFLLADGGCLIDGPGIRELQLWGAAGGLDAAFSDVAALAAACRFRDCRHAGEPGCAVAAAVASGALDPGRLHGYHKLHREIESLAARQDGLARQEERRRWRIIHKSMRRLPPR